MTQLFGPAFAETVRRHPQKAALVDGGETLTYGELDARARRIARSLAAQGVAAGTRVAVVTDSPTVLVPTFLALQYLGAVFAPVSTRLAPQERLAAIRTAEIGTLVADPACLLQDDAVAALPFPLQQIAAPVPADDDGTGPTGRGQVETDGIDAGPETPSGDDAPAVIVFSSGSGGRPKAVLWSRGGFARLLERQAQACDVAADDVLQLAIPLFHGGGLIGVLGIGLCAGATVACHSGPFRAPSVLAQARRDGVTTVHWIPTMLRRIIAHLDETGERPPALKAIHFGSMPIDSGLLERAVELFPDALHQIYATTECGFVAILKPEDFAAGRRATGKVDPQVRMRIVRPDDTDAGTGEVGEIMIDARTSGMAGYVGDPAATNRVMNEGWICSGDLARNDGDGYFTVVGRKDAMIITGGLKVYPPEVEAALATHPDVSEVGVLGLPDPEFGQAVGAFVVLRQPSASGEELRDFCRTRIAAYKVPRRIVVIDAMPRTGTGKVAYDALRRMAEAIPSGAE